MSCITPLTCDHKGSERVRAAVSEGMRMLMARFHSYSFGNILLVRAQGPSGARLGGSSEWLELGRRVKKGVHGLKLLDSFKRRATIAEQDGENDVVVKGFIVGTVFEVAQIDGDSLPDSPGVERIGDAPNRGVLLSADLIDYVELQNVQVARKITEPTNGYFVPMRPRVPWMSIWTAIKPPRCSANEARHVVADHADGVDRRELKTVAESAFVVLIHIGSTVRDTLCP